MLYELITVEHADPFQDFFDFENFMCIFYGKVTQEEYDMANLDLPLDVYKFMICKIFNIAKNDLSKLTSQKNWMR